MTPVSRVRATVGTVCIALGANLLAGCGKGSDDKTPNPELKVPEVPQGRGEDKGGAPKDPKVRKK
ncbi:MAG TPA: hypothetical protein VH092_03820 [Urbifossiella sp.]|jgi:hypothetical protein|nr:hypothetical protein [Urbifossiella sp.]